MVKEKNENLKSASGKNMLAVQQEKLLFGQLFLFNLFCSSTQVQNFALSPSAGVLMN